MRQVFPSSNSFGIPDLALTHPSNLPPSLTHPTPVWGTVSRKKKMSGTWLFYTDDSRFETAWTYPETLPATLCASAIEINFSVFDETPRAEAIWQIYRKRWLSRLWQERGIIVWADLFVAHTHIDLALLGVPNGWQRYATSGQGSRISELDVELTLARERASGSPMTLLVYGGDKSVRDWCMAQPEVVHVPHRRSSVYRPGEGTRRKNAREVGLFDL